MDLINPMSHNKGSVQRREPALTPDELEEQEVVTPRSAKEKKEEEEKKKGFKERNPEISKALEKVKLRDEETAVPSDVKMKESNEMWYSSNLYESLKSKWTK